MKRKCIRKWTGTLEHDEKRIKVKNKTWTNFAGSEGSGKRIRGKKKKSTLK